MPIKVVANEEIKSKPVSCLCGTQRHIKKCTYIRFIFRWTHHQMSFYDGNIQENTILFYR
jgi:hypothetical protein